FNFFSKRTVGDLMARNVNDIEAIRGACGLGLIVGFEGIFLFSFIVPAMLFVSPRLTLITLIPFAVLAFVILKFGNMIEDRFSKVQDSFSRLTETAREILSAIKVIKGGARQEYELVRFATESDDYLKNNLFLIRIWGLYEPLIAFIPGISIAIFLWLGGRSAITNLITLGDFAAILFYLVMLIWPVIAIGWASNLFKRGNASIKRINEILETQPPLIERTSKIEPTIEGNIEFRNLSFSYNGKRALNGINLSIPIGTSLGITGTTGSGKTTLLELLMGILEAPDGKIFVDGIDIRSISPKSLRKGIVFVSRESTIFNGTVLENLSFMDPEISYSEIIEAAKISEIYDEIVQFRDGFNAIVGERGLSVSGGQRQRLAIARAILLRPRVLILDDVLSSLDLRTESAVLKNIRGAMTAITLIVVSSRAPSISGFDRIAVFERGKIVEIGNHNELLSMKGIYEKLYNLHSLK
ncbi:MAG: ABC transporter ATP-binding protein, partial [Thermodesulfobacteriota bacterium]